MPRYASPPLPPEVDRAVQTLGINRARLAIIIALIHGATTMPEIADVTGITTMTVNRHLRELEEAGVVTASLPPSHPARRRASLTWTIGLDQVQEELGALAAALSPPR